VLETLANGTWQPRFQQLQNDARNRVK
jgi:hypothetical protein